MKLTIKHNGNSFYFEGLKDFTVNMEDKYHIEITLTDRPPVEFFINGNPLIPDLSFGTNNS